VKIVILQNSHIKGKEVIFLNNSDTALAIYIFFVLIALLVSYKYASYMIRKTGFFLAYSFIASMINLMLLVISILGWLFSSLGKNEFLFFGGLYLGLISIIVSEFILVIVLLVKRKSMLEDWKKNNL
jgi:hypothetical protein